MDIIHRLTLSLSRISLIWKMILVTFVVGVTVWLVADHFETRAVQRSFDAHMRAMLSEQALEERKSFDNYVKAYSQSVRLFALQKRLIDYAEGEKWHGEGARGMRYHQGLPEWLPRSSVLRLLIHVRYALLLDPSGRVREVYQGKPEPLPEPLLRPTVLLRQLSHNQSFMTRLDGIPFLVASEIVRGPGGEALATLMLASPLDEEFLVTSQGASARESIVALITGENPRILVSSKGGLLPPGTLLDDLKDRYLVAGKGFFDYGASDLAIGFASFISTEDARALTRGIVAKERRQRAIQAVAFIVSFAFIMFLIARRIERLTHRISDFSERVLQGRAWQMERGDQLAMLEKRFQHLTEEVVSAQETIRRESEERAKRKAELQQKEKQLKLLRSVTEGMPEGVFLLDEQDRVVFSNPVGATYLTTLSGAAAGDTLTHMAGRPVRELLVSPPQIMWHEVETDGPHPRVFEVAGWPMEGRGVVFVIRNVTEERALRENMQMQERLAAVGKLAAGIAHDFNNILTVIIGYAELIRDSDLPPKAREEVGIIEQSGQRAVALIHQVLDFSRKTVGELKTIDLLPFVKEFLRFIRRIIPENIHIFFDAEPGEYRVKADLTKMQQVLANLAVNARDAMPEGGQLRFRLSRPEHLECPSLPDSPAGEWVVLEVKDTGKGIPADILPHVFEPFFTTKGVGKGTGLGLSQVYGIVKQHGGHIEVRTEAGEGAAFVVYLPAVKEAVEAAVADRDIDVPRGRGEAILVVEDEGAVRDFVQKVLANLGYKVAAAKNGKDALKVLEGRSGEIGLVITDLVMPEMGGMELSRMINEKQPGVRVIALSSYPVSDKEDLMRAGIIEVIKKPFQIHTLAQAVKGALERKKVFKQEFR
jgi:signal transduction histidine kinase/ActR/RegA family two-component response regulator